MPALPVPMSPTSDNPQSEGELTGSVKSQEPVENIASNRSSKLSEIRGSDGLMQSRSFCVGPNELALEVDGDLRELAWQDTSRLVMSSANPFRQGWMVLITSLLLYTGTVFIWRLAFIDFRIELPEPDLLDTNSTLAKEDAAEANVHWQNFDSFVTVVFWIDLIVSFFFAYVDPTTTKEVFNLRRVVCHYLQTTFAVNLIACIPEQFIHWLVGALSDAAYPDSINQALRATRLQRMSRLARLARLTRLAKATASGKRGILALFEQYKGVRVVNLSCGLAWIVHILACGWYLCAAVHENPEDTWVARRTTDGLGDVSLVTCPPVEQWLNSVYFVFTVFSTVGFGDMSAFTSGEIVYVIFLMAIGAVVHSIIISEVINVVTSSDKVNEFIDNQCDLIRAFAEHTEMDGDSEEALRSWIRVSAKTWAHQRYAKEEMKQLIVGKYLPRTLLGRLPQSMFSGMLVKNKVLTPFGEIRNSPPRLPMLLALSLHKSYYFCQDIIYEMHDYPFNIFLVAAGVFAYVAQPSPKGGMILSTGGSKNSIMVGAFNRSVRSETSVKSGSAGSNAAGNDKVYKSQDSQGSKSPSRKPFQEGAAPPFYPYQLFCLGSYFGDVELLNGNTRRATARCESEEGSLLSIGKAEFKCLCEEFPHMGGLWLRRANFNERVRLRRQRLQTKGLEYEDLAVTTISKFWRQAMKRKTKSSSQVLPPSAMLVETSRNVVTSQVRRPLRNEDDATPGSGELNRKVEALSAKVDTLTEKMDQVMELLLSKEVTQV